MLIKEYHIPLPFTVEEYQKGLLYMLANVSHSNSQSNGVLLEVLTNEPFENNLGKGIFSHRILHIGNRLPDWSRKLLAGSANVLKVEEKSWNAYPYIKTIYTCPLFNSERFEIQVESKHEENSGTTPNIFNLSKQLLKKRQIDVIDIANDPVDDKYYKKSDDPRLFKSKKTGRGPLEKNWKETSKPIMCAYKLVTINFSLWGLRSRVESVLHDVIRSIYHQTHQQTFCWIDQWYDQSLQALLEAELTASVPTKPLTESERQAILKELGKQHSHHHQKEEEKNKLIQSTNNNNQNNQNNQNKDKETLISASVQQAHMDTLPKQPKNSNPLTNKWLAKL